jgi:hypothetical protein
MRASGAIRVKAIRHAIPKKCSVEIDAVGRCKLRAGRCRRTMKDAANVECLRIRRMI